MVKSWSAGGGLPMTTSKIYQDQIELCRELAKEAEFPEDRNLFLKIADTWNWIAEDCEIPVGGKSSACKRKAAK